MTPEVEGMVADLQFYVHPDEIEDWVWEELQGLLDLDIGELIMVGVGEQKMRDVFGCRAGLRS